MSVQPTLQAAAKSTSTGSNCFCAAAMRTSMSRTWTFAPSAHGMQKPVRTWVLPRRAYVIDHNLFCSAACPVLVAHPCVVAWAGQGSGGRVTRQRTMRGRGGGEQRGAGQQECENGIHVLCCCCHNVQQLGRGNSLSLCLAGSAKK